MSASAELDITSFMNLMIILVPVLLMSMVFSQTTILRVTLPGLAALETMSEDALNQPLEVVVRQQFVDINYPAGVQLQRIEHVDKVFDRAALSEALQAIKQTLAEQELEKRDITLLVEPDIDYQYIVTVMDTVRSYETVVVTSVVDAELFPDISFGDAPSERAQ